MRKVGRCVSPTRSFAQRDSHMSGRKISANPAVKCLNSESTLYTKVERSVLQISVRQINFLLRKLISSRTSSVQTLTIIPNYKWTRNPWSAQPVHTDYLIFVLSTNFRSKINEKLIFFSLNKSWQITDDAENGFRPRNRKFRFILARKVVSHFEVKIKSQNSKNFEKNQRFPKTLDLFKI